jgi:UDP-N-acetylmuramate dehydrogenase
MFLENASLKSFHTFGLGIRARFLAVVDSDDELRARLLSVTARNRPLLILGGGSNILPLDDFPGLVIVLRQRGIRVLSASADEVLVEAAAGENWHEFVQFCLRQGWYGLENLSLIPGTVGASPVQNIGAYGVEIKDRFAGLTAMSRLDGCERDFSAADCRFAYRDSVFKQEERDRWVITRVRFRLTRSPVVQVAYGDIRRELERCGVVRPGPVEVARAVMAIRRAKLPDPSRIGNAGSFFKNPVVPFAQYDALKNVWPDLAAYPQADGVKLAAGWLIDRCGWKGARRGDAGVYEKQALVLVNHGAATGRELLRLAMDIRASVIERFGVPLDMEPVLVG